MDASLRIGLAQAGFVSNAMDVNITLATIDLTARIETGLQSFQRENTIGDQSGGVAFAIIANGLAPLEYRADGFVIANFFADSMQSERCLEGSFLLAGAVDRGGYGQGFGLVAVIMGQRLGGYLNMEAVFGGPVAVLLASL